MISEKYLYINSSGACRITSTPRDVGHDEIRIKLVIAIPPSLFKKMDPVVVIDLPDSMYKIDDDVCVEITAQTVANTLQLNVAEISTMLTDMLAKKKEESNEW